MFCRGIDTTQAGLSWASGLIHLLAKYKREATVIDEACNALLDSIPFANSKAGEKLLALFQQLEISREDLLIGMEATGHSWPSVYRYLIEQEFKVKGIKIPSRLWHFERCASGRQRMTGRTVLSSLRLCASGSSPPRTRQRGIVALRQLSRYRLALVDTCGDCKRRIIALLDQVFPEYGTLFSDAFGVTSKEVLSQYPTLENMLSVSIRKLTTLLGKASHGRFEKEKAEQLKAVAVVPLE